MYFKKSLGQHFLHNKKIADKIVNSLNFDSIDHDILEIGAGKGILTKLLIDKLKTIDDKAPQKHLKIIEIDTGLVDGLKNDFPEISNNIISGNALKINWSDLFKDKYLVIGNFPYNISSQIMFNVIENRGKIHQVVGMFQKEVGERICGSPGSKKYGILSVLLQTYYNCRYLFTVDNDNFKPVPKVKSGVIQLIRNHRNEISCNEELFKNVIKSGFNKRRKILKNSLSKFLINYTDAKLSDLLIRRPEQLNVEEFIYLTGQIEKMNHL